MKQFKQMVAGLALAMMVVVTAGTARANEVPVPAQAITAEVPVVIWIDVQNLRVDDIRASVNRVAELLPQSMAEHREPMKQEAERGLADFAPMLEGIREAGVEGVLLVVPGTAMGGAGMGGSEEPMALIKTAPNATPEQINAAARQLADGPEPPAEVVPYADGWMRIAEPGSPDIRNGEEAHAAAFRELLGASGDAPIRVVLRITPEMRQQIAQQGQDPMMAGFARSLESLNTAWTTIRFGQQPAITNQLNFENQAAATEFKTAWDGMLMMAEGMVMGQIGQMPDAPAPATVQRLFRSLQMQQQGEALSLRLGDDFIAQAAEFAPAAMGMAMMMMMGGADFGPAPQDDWQPRPQQRF